MDLLKINKLKPAVKRYIYQKCTLSLTMSPSIKLDNTEFMDTSQYEEI